MKYFVRNEHGELTFGSIHELRAMFDQGMVGPDDEVRPEDSQSWRKAAAIPELRASAAAKAEGKGWGTFALVTTVCLVAALAALVRFHSWIIAAVLMIPVLGMSQRAFTRAMKRDRS